MSKPFRIVVYRDGEAWVGQCLEVDIGAQAESPNELRDRLDAVIAAEYHMSLENGQGPFSGLPAAPEYFFSMWDNCKTPPVDWDGIPGVEETEFQAAMCA